MSEDRLHVPGPGLVRAGMGREIAEAEPEAMAVYEEGSEASGLDLKRLCFSGTAEELTRDRSAAAGARRHAASRSTRRCAPAASRRTTSSATPSASSRRSARPTRSSVARDDRARARARPRDGRRREASLPGSMAAILGLADEVVEALCRKIHNVWPANYNCPGQLVISGETDAVDECCDEAQREGARRAVRLRVSGAFHSPLVELAAERLRPAIDKIDFKVPTAHFVSTVTAKLEDAQRYRTLLVEQLTAPVKFTQSAREMIEHGVTTFVEVGPGNVLSGLLKRIDSSVKAISGQRPEVARRRHAGACLADASGSFCSLEGTSGARHRRLARHRPRDRGRARACRRRGRRRLPLGRRRGRRARSARSAAAPSRPTSPRRRTPQRLVEEAGDLDILVNNAGLTRDGLLARMSDDDWREVIETNLSSVFYTCRAVTRPMMKRRAGAIVNVGSIVGRARQPGPDELRRREGRDHRLHQVARARARLARRSRQRRSRRVMSKTRLTDVLPEEAKAAMLQTTPLGRLGDPGRRRRGGTVSLLRRGLVHHGRGAARRRRTGDVVAVDERQRTQAGRRSPGSGWSRSLGNDAETSLAAAARRRVRRGRDHALRPPRTTRSTSRAS